MNFHIAPFLTMELDCFLIQVWIIRWEQILNEIPGYSDQEKERVRDILFEQMRKYKYLFKN